jgi:hypothetical protein
MIFLGDVFDSSAPHWDVYILFQTFLEKRGESNTYILDGNHDQSKTKGHSLSSFSSNLFSNVFIYALYSETVIEQHKCLVLPFLYNNMKEIYEALEGEYDFVFPHFETSKTAFGMGVNNIKLKGTYVLGHQHMQKDYIDSMGNQHHVLGVPITTRHGEHKQNHRIMRVNDKKVVDFIKVPQYFTYRDLEYGDEIKKEWGDNDIINVKNAPSMNSVREKYKNLNVRESGVTLKEFDEGVNEETFAYSDDALNVYFKDFTKETELPDDSYQTIIGYFDKYVPEEDN